jgi:2',3'-cyclic-nucleotide 2'-phosphodiesterase (5'-nucleotidase family)
MATVNGTAGDDLLFIDGGKSNDTLLGLAGNDSLDASTGAGNNIVRGGEGNDELFGYTNDQLFGDAGNDQLNSDGNGSNTLDGGDGDDTLYADRNDTIIGGVGNDVIFAGLGGNTFTGGLGQDVFRIAEVDIPTAPNTITDFNQRNDTIRVNLAGVNQFSDLTVSQVGNDATLSFGSSPLAVIRNTQANTLNSTTVAVSPSAPNNPGATTPFKLQLLHFSDQEAGIPAIEDAPRLSAVLNALKNQDGSDADTAPDFANTLILSSGDVFIPGAFLSAGQQAYGGQGRADILIQNELGIQATVFGNHEFDLGTSLVASLLRPGAAVPATATTPAFPAYPGAAFPYLSGNLNFAPDANLAPLVTADGQEASTIPGRIAASTVITVNGERIGIVGATTPTLRNISSPGSVGVSPVPFAGNPSAAELDALAAVVQADVDALLAANPDINKVVLLTHLQQISIEQGLATRLRNVDIVVAGGSNTRLTDSNDVLRAGDTSQGQYPIFATAADGKPIAVVNTDGNYKYVGRLVVDFDAAGNIIPTSYDVNVSGAYATDAAGVAALNAQALVDPEVQTIVNNVRTVVAAQDGAIFGRTEVFLNGTRSDVRTQETNFGNLSADANLAIGRSIDPTVTISVKNGGGIRDNIGVITFPTGGTNASDALRLPPEANPLANKATGDISQLDITNSLRFNNGLTLVTVTAAQLLQVIEHSVAGTAPGATPGQFGQFGGVRFSFDATRPAGDRVLSLSVVSDQPGAVPQIVARNSEIVGNPDRTFRIITLNFLASGGDNYPFPAFQTANPALFNRVDLLGEIDTNNNGFEASEDLNRNGRQDAAIVEAAPFGRANFASFGSEQDALAEYLLQAFPNATQPFRQADTAPALDERIQNLAVRQDTVIPSNLAPTAVVFSNVVATIAENSSTTSRVKLADLAITDDGAGTNTLSLSGTDAASFELEGNALFLKAGTALNFEAKNSFDLAINADDTTVGQTPDATSRFAFAVTNVDEAPIGSPTTMLANTVQNTAINITAAALLAGFSDVDAGSTLTVTNLTASNGRIVNNNGTFTLTPATNFSGAINLTYGVSDGVNTLAGQTRSFSVLPPLFAPTVPGAGLLQMSQGGGSSTALLFSKISHLANNRNELGVFAVDDNNGTVNNIAPGQSGYLAEVLKRSQVVFAALGNSAVDVALDGRSTRTLNLPINSKLGFYLAVNGTTDDLALNPNSTNIVFSFPANVNGFQNSQITQTTNSTRIAFEDITGGGDQDFDDLVVQIENATASAPLGVAQQGTREIFDLSGVTTTARASFEISRDAAFNNHIGFYKIEDALGAIRVGETLVRPGENGYRQAAVQGRLAGIDLVGTNGQTVNSSGDFTGGALYAPLLIANASTANSDFSNVYTAYSLGNADRADHIRLLGDNTFGFEDLAGGGDRDFNDVIVKATFQ